MKVDQKLIFTLSILFLTIIASCEKKETIAFTDSPIIESYIEPSSYFTVKISRQTPFTSNGQFSDDDLNNLSLSVLYNNTTHTLIPIGDGTYIDSSIVVAAGDNYSLSFTYSSKSVSAYTYTPSKPTNITQSVTSITIERLDISGGPPSGGMPTQPDPVLITWDNADASYYLIVVENMESTLDPIRDFGDNAPPGNLFRKAPTNAASEELRAMDFQYYGMHRIIIYHVLPDYASLYEENSTSSQNLTNPSTSIVNGYGIFTGLNSDTLFILVNE
ncbi:MAG: hypothetical protein IPO63_03055 [Bacteroidetes bacterium]|nr:hypothetical protein [Bacteroidota bacterium]